MSERKRVIITAGGTKEWIDDVRYISNFSTGRFGHSIARAAMELDFDVTVLSPAEMPILNGGYLEGVIYQSYTDTESLKNLLFSQPRADIVFHAAAVSDYRPRFLVDGKISSNQNSLTIELERTPKILPALRAHFGVGSFLVGFKLLSRVGGEELVQAALEQTRKTNIDLTVANELSYLRGENHPIQLVDSKGQVAEFNGRRLNVARSLVDFVRKEAMKKDERISR